MSGRSFTAVNYYRLLGVSPSATTAEIEDAYVAKMAQLASYERKDTRPDVAVATQQARRAIDEAKRTLEDVALRSHHDAELRLTGELEEGVAPPEHRESWRRRHAEHVWEMEREIGSPLTPVFGLHPPSEAESRRKSAPEPSEGLPKPERYVDPLEAVADWLAPHPQPARTVTVPNVCGWHVSDALFEITRAGLHFQFEQISANSNGKGIVISQEPVAGRTVRRDTKVILQVVHPDNP